MRGNNSMNTSSLASKRMARKASKVRRRRRRRRRKKKKKKKNGQFSDQKCSVYLCTFVMQPHQYQSSAAQMAQHTKCARKGKIKEREREREKGGKDAGSNRKNKTKQKKKKKKNKKKSKLCLISCLCWIPEVNIQPYPHFGCIFKTLDKVAVHVFIIDNVMKPSRCRLFIAAIFLSLWRHGAVDSGLSVKHGLGHLGYWQIVQTQIRRRRAFHCSPFIYSVISNNSFSGRWRHWSDCADSQAGLGLRCPHLPEDTFVFCLTRPILCNLTTTDQQIIW